MTSKDILREWSGCKMETIKMSFSAEKIKADRLTYGIPKDTKWGDKDMEYYDGMEVVFKLDENGELIEPGMMHCEELKISLEIWADWCI